MFSKSFRGVTDPDIFLEKLKNHWLDFYAQFEPPPSPRVIVDTQLLERLAENQHTLFLIFDNLKFDLAYIGKNAEQFIGYSLGEISRQKFSLIFKLAKLNQLSFFYKILEWAMILRGKLPIESKREYMSYVICGLTFQHKDGRKVRVLIKVLALELNPQGFTTLDLIEVVDITNLLKNDDYWVRVAAGKDREHTHCFFPDPKIAVSGDIISTRELEVLRLIHQGLQSREIAEQLFISPSTVEKHRKNMIARFGARDTTALTEICKHCGIL